MRLQITMIIIALQITVAMAQNIGYTIVGEIKDLPDGVTFYLIKNDDDGKPDTIERAKSKNQQFVFKEKLDKPGQFRFVKMDMPLIKTSNKGSSEKKKTWVRLLLDNSGTIIKLNGSLSEWPKVDVKDSKLTKDYDLFFSSLVEVEAQWNEKVNGIHKDSISIVEAYKMYNKTYLENLKLIPDSYAVPFFIFNITSLDIEAKKTAYQKMSEKLKNSYYGEKLGRIISDYNASKSIRIGKEIPDFIVKNREGKTESIKQLFMNSRYTLIDFWASWCPPCRADVPELKRVYNTFNNVGFNILSISTDKNVQAWMKALKEENTPWTNVMQENGESNNIFGITAIPSYILLNNKAEIIVMGITTKYTFKQEGSLNSVQAFMKEHNLKGLRNGNLYKVMEKLFEEGK